MCSGEKKCAAGFLIEVVLHPTQTERITRFFSDMYLNSTLTYKSMCKAWFQ